PGRPAFLAVRIDPAARGAAVVGEALPGTPAARAGLRAGDRVTAVSGSTVRSAGELRDAVGRHRPGDRVAVAWVDGAGAPHTATVVLAEGPVA
ncbi:PDZ domain-containing protein, partial [Amnibacterium endophyticum]